MFCRTECDGGEISVIAVSLRISPSRHPLLVIIARPLRPLSQRRTISMPFQCRLLFCRLVPFSDVRCIDTRPGALSCVGGQPTMVFSIARASSGILKTANAQRRKRQVETTTSGIDSQGEQLTHRGRQFRPCTHEYSVQQLL